MSNLAPSCIRENVQRIATTIVIAGAIIMILRITANIDFFTITRTIAFIVVIASPNDVSMDNW